MPQPQHQRRVLSSTLLATCLILVLALGVSAQVATLEEPGASAAPSAPTGASGATTVDDPQEAMLAFAQCMRDNGIEMDDPQFDEGGRGVIVRIGGPGEPGFDPESEQFQAAQQACGSLLEAARPQLDPAAQAEFLDQQLAMAQCLREHGIEDYPDPVIDSDGRLQRVAGSTAEELTFDPFSEEFRSAREACASELGIEGGPGLGGPPPGATP